MQKNILVFFGASQIPVGVATWAVANGWTAIIVANSSQMMKKLNGIAIKDIAEKSGIKTLTFEKSKDITPGSLNVDPNHSLFISAGSPWIFKHEILSGFGNQVMNLHGTRLPKDRGGTLFSWQILTGQKTGICLLHQMTEGIDDGPVLSYEEFIYPSNCRLPKDYIAVYEQTNINFIIGFIKNYKIVTHQIQPEYLSTYWPRLRADVHGWINWDWSFSEIERQICAFDDPYGGARCRFRNKMVIIRDAYAQSTDGYTHPFQNGLVYRNNGKWINVAARGGELLICSVVNEDGNNIISEIKPGDRLYTHHDDLINATVRVVKSPGGLTIKDY